MMRLSIMLLLMLLSVCAASRKSSKGICNHGCGQAEEISESQKEQLSLRNPRKKKLRIVNGYEPPSRSFLVLIYIKNGESTCGGTIINDRFILTAGHCVCLANNEILTCSGNVISYPTSDIKVYLGVNNQNVSALDNRDGSNDGIQVRTAIEVIIHDKWDGTGYPNLPDLAVIKLNRRIRFQKYKMAPICLPRSSKLNNYGKTVYAAGWGATANIGGCLTNDDGPAKHVRCRRPFQYKGKIFDDCLTIDSPSADNEICKEFRKSIGSEKYSVKTRNSAKVVYGKGKNVTCYRFHHKFGWCGTCDRSARDPDDAGYCGYNDYYQPEDETMVAPTSEQGWGFCSKQCAVDNSETTNLQEVKLTVIKPRECKDLIGDSEVLSFNEEIEICAGFKIKFPKTRVYRRLKIKGQDHQYIFRRQRSERNRLGVTGRAANLNFYIGHADSCQGDSGGPLYRFIRERAVLVGVVSRGEHCAGFNQPGIYTHVSKFLPWIKKVTRKGRCGRNKKKKSE